VEVIYFFVYKQWFCPRHCIRGVRGVLKLLDIEVKKNLEYAGDK
jgi:hypothetical protein